MNDIVLVTADSVRLDYVDHFNSLDSLQWVPGVATAHYTRPSLASLLSSSYEAALMTEVQSPTLANELQNAGYSCFGFSPTPNTDSQFGFGNGFDVYETFVDAGSEGSRLRQYLSRSRLARKIYYAFNPPQAKSEARPNDRIVVDRAIEAFNAADAPRFLWVHLMESHRPYGSGEDALSKALDQKAFFNPDTLSDEERATIDRKYRDALSRVEKSVKFLGSNLQTDESHFLFTSDHGEAFGEPGFYFHPGHERCVDDVQINVPVGYSGFELQGPLSLIDIAPTLLESVGLDPPKNWHGKSRLTESAENALTIAPWNNKATLAWQDFETKIVAPNANLRLERDSVTVVPSRADVQSDLKEQLKDLGYLDVG